jgi:hypothetical protein
MIRLILFTIVCIVMLALPSHSQDVSPQEAYIRHFLQNYPRRMEKAVALLPVIDGYSAIHAIDPVLVTVTIAAESSFDASAINAGRTERGLMQVHGVCARGYDLSDTHQQIAAGVACLAMARDACDGSLAQTVSMYISGHCIPRTERTLRVVNRRVQIVEKWRNK